MKQILFSLGIGILLLSTLSSSEFQEKNDTPIYMASYPRSGSNWLTYIIECTCGVKRMKGAPFSGPKLNPSRDLKKRIINTHHFGKSNLRKGEDQIPVILIIRNFKDCYVSHIKNHSSSITKDPVEAIHWGITNQPYFFTNIETFDKVAEEKKLLIYYEDLLSNPEKEIARVMEFLCGKSDPEIIKNFCDKLQEHQKASLIAYGYKKKPLEKATKINQHSSKIPVKELRKIDERVKKEFPDIWKKYLLRYKN